MGVLPLQFPPGRTRESLGLTGEEEYSITGLEGGDPGADIPTEVTVRADHHGQVQEFPATVRIDTPRRRHTSGTAGYCNTCCDSSSSPERLAMPTGAASAGQNGSGGPGPRPARSTMRKQRLSNSPAAPPPPSPPVE